MIPIRDIPYNIGPYNNLTTYGAYPDGHLFAGLDFNDGTSRDRLLGLGVVWGADT